MSHPIKALICWIGTLSWTLKCNLDPQTYVTYLGMPGDGGSSGPPEKGWGKPVYFRALLLFRVSLICVFPPLFLCSYGLIIFALTGSSSLFFALAQLSP